MPVSKEGNASIDLIKDGWLNPEGADALNPIYVSTTSFKVDGDLTDVFTSGRAVKIDFQSSGEKLCSIMTSSYDGGTDKTTVVVFGESLVNEVISELLVSASTLQRYDWCVIHVQDQKSAGTNGGTFTSGSWQTRTLNTVIKNTISGASLASNQITLPAGSYYIEASAPAFKVGLHMTLLYDVTNSATLKRGTSEFTNSGGGYAQTRSFLRTFFTLTGEADIEFRHRCQTTYASSGFGSATSFTTEVYADVIIWRVG
jgi:hypothetical protein